MSYFVGTTSTGFISTGEISTGTLPQSCEIVGDQTLIGTGIRVGFYLLYAAAIIAVLFGVDKRFRFWHGAWGVLALSLFLFLFLNITSSNLVIIDYAILIELVLWYPVYFVVTILSQQVPVIGKSHSISDNELHERLQRCWDRSITQRDIARARGHVDILKAFALYASAEAAEKDLEHAQAGLSNAIRLTVSHFHEGLEGQGQDNLTTVYDQGLIDEISAAPTRSDVYKLRKLYIAALLHMNASYAEARTAEQEVTVIAAEELGIERRNHLGKRVLRHFLLTCSYKDQLAAAIGLLVWSMYIFGTAALNWPMMHYGLKSGGICDDVPTVYFIFAPKKPFIDGSFSSFLKVWTVGACILAIFTTAVAFFILAVSLFGPSVVDMAIRRRKKKDKRPAEGDNSKDHSRRARGQHSQDILDCICRADVMMGQERYSLLTRSPIHFTLWNIPWATLLAVLLVMAITCSELTIRRQGPNNNRPVYFKRPPLHEISEILAFLIGLYSLALTCLSIAGGIVLAILRPRKRKVKRTV